MTATTQEDLPRAATSPTEAQETTERAETERLITERDAATQDHDADHDELTKAKLLAAEILLEDQ